MADDTQSAEYVRQPQGEPRRGDGAALVVGRSQRRGGGRMNPLLDTRRWTNREPEFAVAAFLVVVEPAELDVLELGHRPAVAYCKEIADEWERTSAKAVRTLHPVEYQPARIDGQDGS